MKRIENIEYGTFRKVIWLLPLYQRQNSAFFGKICKQTFWQLLYGQFLADSKRENGKFPESKISVLPAEMLNEAFQDDASRLSMLDEAVQDEAARPPMLDEAIQDEAANAERD